LSAWQSLDHDAVLGGAQPTDEHKHDHRYGQRRVWLFEHGDESGDVGGIPSREDDEDGGEDAQDEDSACEEPKNGLDYVLATGVEVRPITNASLDGEQPQASGDTQHDHHRQRWRTRSRLQD